MPEYAARRAFRILVTPVGLALISAVRLVIISNYDVTTAVTVAESGGYVNTFLGSLIPLVPVFMPYLALVFLAFRRFILCALAIAATVLISPVVVRPSVVTLGYFDNYWLSTLHSMSGHVQDALSAIAIGILICGLIMPWGDFRGWVYTLVTTLWACAAVVTLLPYLLIAYPAPGTQSLASYLRQPWLTAEQITVDPSKIYQGYVLSSDDQWMTVLLYQSRTIAYFRADSVTARIVCEPPAKPSPSPLVRLVNAKSASLPECRDSDSWAVSQHGASSAATKTRSNSTKTGAPIRGTEARVVSPPKRHGSHKVPRPCRPCEIARRPTPPTRFHHHHRIATSGDRSMHHAGGSPRSPQQGSGEALAGELFLLCASYRDKSPGDICLSNVPRSRESPRYSAAPRHVIPPADTGAQPSQPHMSALPSPPSRYVRP
jgi:hypothetical protein